jgi:hypothetical protein
VPLRCACLVLLLLLLLLLRWQAARLQALQGLRHGMPQRV